MTEQEISVKLTETEQRAKSNTHRIEKLEQQQKDLNKLVTAVEVLASREKGVETDVKEIKADVKTITQKGGKRWDAMIDRVLYVLIGAAISPEAGGFPRRPCYGAFRPVPSWPSSGGCVRGSTGQQGQAERRGQQAGSGAQAPQHQAIQAAVPRGPAALTAPVVQGRV